MVWIFRKYPLLSGMATYGGMWTASSISQQMILSHHKVNYETVKRNALVGAFVMCPLLHGWYRVVGRVMGVGVRTWRQSITISAVEQAVFGPIILTAFYTSTGVLAGDSAEWIRDELRTKLPTTYITSCCFFPLLNFINHRFVPFHYKLAYQATISFLWSNFLCLMKEKPVEHLNSLSNDDHKELRPSTGTEV